LIKSNQFTPNRFWQDERDNKLMELFNAGMLIRKIAEEMGITKNRASGRLWRLKMFRRVPEFDGFEARMRKLNKFPKNSNGCLYGIGHVNEEKFRFCGDPSKYGLPYCEKHARKAYRQSEVEE
jgi:hypothetical protein